MPKKGYKQTKEHKDKISKNHADVSGKNNPMYGSDRSGKKNGMFRKGYLLSGEKHYNWKGGEYLGAQGRWVIWIDGICYVRARYIAMKCLDRELTFEEEVHHIDENCSDDCPENLYLFATKGEHVSHHKMKNPPILITNLLNN